MTIHHNGEIELDNQVKKGFMLQQNGKISEAKLIYEEVLLLDSEHFNALQLLGLIELEAGNFERAIMLLKRAIKLDPLVTNSQINIANAYTSIDNYKDAIAHYSKALEINPRLSQPYYGLGLCYDRQKKVDIAIKNYIHAIEIEPNFKEAYLNLGVCLEEKRMWETALESYDRVIEIDHQYASAHNNRGNTLKELHRFDEAIQSYHRAISINPNYVEAYSNLGVAYRDLNLLNESLDCFEKAISIEPNYYSAKFNRSLTLLHSGKISEGFREYEWRWESNSLKRSKRNYLIPLWLGEQSLLGKTILIYGEQGLGDVIQFCRYVEMVASSGANVILEVPISLSQLMKSIKGVSKVVTKGDQLPHLDYQCPMMSLPLAFKTELDTIPAKIPYLNVPEEKKQYWRERLGEHNKLRVGLTWAGGFRTDQPELWSVNNRRNIALEKLVQFKDVDVQFYSLQKGELAESEFQKLRECNWGGPNITYFTSELIDFTDTAAFIENLDLVISVDTSIAHLAGALGKQVWLLNRYDTCWRWLLDREDSPWYPTLKIYRQESYDDWDSVVLKMKRNLENLVSRNFK